MSQSPEIYEPGLRIFLFSIEASFSSYLSSSLSFFIFRPARVRQDASVTGGFQERF